MKDGLSHDPFQTAAERGIGRFSQITSGDYDKFDSDCSKSMIGFVQNIPSKSGERGTMTNHKIQCFHGVQEKEYDIEKTEEFNTGKMKFNRIV